MPDETDQWREKMQETIDYPFEVACFKAVQLVEAGWRVHQKFTCDGCGNRLTMETPNHFYETGSCDKCSTITDIKKKGCNYMLRGTFR